MFRKPITIGVAMLLTASALSAQQRGTVEFGGFGSVGTFERDIGLLDKGVGGGARLGVFLHPRLAIESEWGEMKVSRELGFEDVNAGILSVRLMAIVFGGKPFQLVVGAGAANSTETNRVHSYGYNALVGARISLGDKAVLRIDAVQDWLANYDNKAYRRLLGGISFTRNPFQRVRVDTVINTVTVQGPAPAMRPDSVSAAETARLRRAELDYRNLVDSLRRNPPSTAAASTGMSAAAIGTMEQKIFFDFDRSTLTADARLVLDQKVTHFQANPQMRIIIVGHADPIGGDVYNLNLGMRRAESAKAYLVSKGVDATRIETSSRGETQPVVTAGNDKSANAPNRRDEFRVLIFGSGRQ